MSRLDRLREMREARYAEAQRKEAELSTRAKRKVRRELEADAYAKDAKVWKGRPKSADRIGYDKPVDRQAAKTLRKKRKARK